MHSFMFDFKMGEYLISPILESAYESHPYDRESLNERIRAYSNAYIERLPPDFFPGDGKWYSYDNIVHDRNKKRPYIAKEHPKYR